MNWRNTKFSALKQKKKLDPILSIGLGMEEIDYKNTELLSQFITSRGTILPRRASRLKAVTQRKVTQAIKRARIVGLLPFDRMSRS